MPLSTSSILLGAAGFDDHSDCHLDHESTSFTSLSTTSISSSSLSSRRLFTAFGDAGDCAADKRTRYNMLPTTVNSNSAMEQRNAAWGKNDYKDRKDWTCVGGPGFSTQGIPGYRYGASM